ncbi:MAG: DNA cytosine methyltransferase [Acidobacteriota bacterium]|jgi:DNA (cytosine-5)-methyltransferase 1
MIDNWSIMGELSYRGGKSRPRAAKRLTALDLFSGCGGLSEGMRLAGFDVLGGVEIDPLSAESYQLNHPGAKLWIDDIRQLDPTKIMADLELKEGDLDLLAGCPPCQGFSTIRTRKKTTAAEDPRNALVNDFLRFVRVMRPRAIMLENVPGLASFEGFKTVERLLTEAGYQCRYDVLDAADFGVPQRRKRFVLLGSRDGEIQFASPLPRRKTVRDAIGGLAEVGTSGDPLHDVPEKRSSRIVDMIARIPHDGGSRSDLPNRMQLRCHRDCEGFHDVYGRMAWDQVAPTITAGCINPSKGRFLHPEQDRAITPREAALLQSFPAGYKFSLRQGKYGAARLIGNAFPPEFARHHAHQVARHLNAAQGGANG